MGDFTPDRLDSRSIQALWEWNDRFILEEHHIFNVAIPLEVEREQSCGGHYYLGSFSRGYRILLLPRFSGLSRGYRRTSLAERETYREDP